MQTASRFLRLSTLLAVCLCCLAGPAFSQKTLMMATTTSTQDSGLLDALAPVFKKETGIELKWVSVGTGKALEHGKNCDVDVLMVHAPKAEKEFVAAGHGVDRREFMYNDYVLVGPAADPAGIKGKPAPEALKAIAEKKATFVSRGDDSGTHKAEQGLWKDSGLATPDKESWYVQAGQGMTQTLTMAGEKGGYALTDRGTFISFEASAVSQGGKPSVVILSEGDKALRNQYSVMMVNPEKCPKVQKELAGFFLGWWTSPSGQKHIADYKLKGKQLFFPNAGK